MIDFFEVCISRSLPSFPLCRKRSRSGGLEDVKFVVLSSEMTPPQEAAFAELFHQVNNLIQECAYHFVDTGIFTMSQFHMLFQ